MGSLRFGLCSALLWVGLGLASACGDDDGVPIDGGGADVAVRDGGMDTAVAADGGPADAATDVSIDAAVEPGHLAIGDFTYEGAFRFSAAEFGESSVNYAVGTLGYNPDRHSLFIAGHAQHAMLAEFAIPDTLGTEDDVAALPVVEEPLQSFRPLLERAQTGNPDAIDRVTGMLWRDGDLLVNGNNWYDAAGSASDTTLVIPGGDLDGTVEGYYKLEGAARIAGFMAYLPTPWAERLGAPALAGWASNYSIVSRYSVGPTLFAFDPAAVAGETSQPIPTRAYMDFAYGGGAENFLAPDALEYDCDRDMETDVTTCAADAGASPLWNVLSRAMYGFIVPGTTTYALFGRSAGIESGIGYKIRQEEGRLCGGPCARRASDYYNYYWFFDVDEIMTAASPSAPRPYAYGEWSIPFDDDGSHSIIGGDFVADEGRLYLALGGAGQTGD